MTNMTSHKSIDVLGIGNAIVDILSYKEPAFVEEQGFAHGSMQLIDAARVEALGNHIGTSTDCSGGSAANTLAGIAMLGGATKFIGKVHDDPWGRIFKKDLERIGVQFDSEFDKTGDPTARCIVMVTEEENPYGGPPNVERTMATYLGVAGQVGPNDVNSNDVEAAKILFIEGYLFDSPSARDAIDNAVPLAKAAGTKIAFTLSDAFCVERHLDAFKQFIENDVDILFANEHEIEAITGTGELRSNLLRAAEWVETAAVTRSAQGSYVLQDDEVHAIDARKVDNVYDVTGAGDLYAAGFLYGYTHGFSPEDCGRLASACAAEVIQYLGGRPMTKLSDLLDDIAA